MYPYIVPPGMGDSFYIYTVNGEDIPIVLGGSYSLLGITVEDADFIWRAWSGAALLLAGTGTVQIYDGVRNAFFQLPILQAGMFPPSMAIVPEKKFRNNTSLRFDLTNTALATNSNGTTAVYADQMAWYGVKRSPGGIMDPGKSVYKYYEKPFIYPLTFQLTNYGPSNGALPIPGLAAPTQYTQLITDYDFELRRIIKTVVSSASGFASLLIDSEAGAFLVTAVVSGTGGNAITIAIVAGAIPNFTVQIGVVGNAITITIPLDLYAAASTVVNAINTNPASAALVTAMNVNNPVATVPLLSTTHLSGGSGGGGSTPSPYASPFKITLYDAAWRARTNIPILAELICTDVNSANPQSTAPNNAWPSPPLMYPINSVIRFDIYSLIPTGDALPVSVTLLFDGVRRIAC